MAVPALAETGLDRPSPDEAAAALRRIAKAWELDRHDTTALLGVTGGDLGAVEWTDERLLRAAYLVELEAALVRLNPKGGTPRWVVTPNPGPFFAGNTPLQLLTGSTREMAEVLRQVRRWSAARRAGNTKPH
jgi:hypothetical protein